MVSNSEMIIKGPRLWKRDSLTFRQCWHVDNVRELIIIFLHIPHLSSHLRQASRAWVRLQPWAVSTLEIWTLRTGQWLHNGYCTSKWYGPLWSISQIHLVLLVKVRLWQAGAYMTKGLPHSEYLRIHVSNNIPSIPLHTSSAVCAM